MSAIDYQVPADIRALSDAIFGGKSALRCDADQLRSLADALYVVGNENLGSTLDAIADRVVATADAIADAYMNNVAAESGRIDKSFRETVSMAFAVLDRPQKDPTA